MKKKELKKLAERVLSYENIIEAGQSEDEEVKSAKDKIMKIMYSLSEEDALELDDKIMELTMNN